MLPGRAIVGSIDEDDDGTLTFDGEFSTTRHPDGTTTPDTDEKIELKELLDNEKVAVDDAERSRAFWGELLARLVHKSKLLKMQETCQVTIVGAGSMIKGTVAKFEALGLPFGGSYSWTPTVNQNVGGLLGVQQSLQYIGPPFPRPHEQEYVSETTMRAEGDNGTVEVGVVYKAGNCVARASKKVRLTK